MELFRICARLSKQANEQGSKSVYWILHEHITSYNIYTHTQHMHPSLMNMDGGLRSMSESACVTVWFLFIQTLVYICVQTHWCTLLLPISFIYVFRRLFCLGLFSVCLFAYFVLCVMLNCFTRQSLLLWGQHQHPFILCTVDSVAAAAAAAEISWCGK